MKKNIITALVIISAFAIGYFAADLSGCPCAKQCACTACNCSK